MLIIVKKWVQYLKQLAAAAAANLLFVFKIPASIEDKLTKSKKGKVILVNSTAKLNFSLSAKKPGAIRYTTTGVKSLL